MNTLSVVVITKNEERDLPDCLRSVAFADEVIVVDAESEDRTVEVARAAGARVIVQPWLGFSAQRALAINAATKEWILVLDADERVSKELRTEIESMLRSNGAADGYYIPRRTYFLDRWIAHAGWYPRPQLRLFRRGRGQADGRIVHEGFVVDGHLGRMRGDIIHHSHTSLAGYLENQNRCTTLEALEAIDLGMRFAWGPPIGAFARFLRDAASGPPSRERLYALAKDHFKNRVAVVWLVPFQPIAKFVRMYFFQGGFRDGVHGFVLALMSAIYVVVKYCKLWELSSAAREGRLERDERKGRGW